MKSKAFVLFGASGDLAKQKIFSSIENIKNRGGWDSNLKIVTYSRKEPHVRHNFIHGDFENLDSLVEYISENKVKELFFYFAIPPSLYSEVIIKIFKTFGKLKIHVALEKPFGNSYKEAVELAKLIKKLGEKNFYLIDHYMGKYALMVLKNKFEKQDIKKIEVVMTDSIDLATRGKFYDSVGEIKDIGQNHLLIMLSSVLGQDFDGKKLIYVKKSLKIGQFKGYRKIEGVNPKSKTETYFEAKFKYKDISILLRSGKAMKDKSCYININDTVLVNINFKQERLPHEYIISDFLSKNNKYAINLKQALGFWKIINPLLKERGSKRIIYYSKYSL